MNLFLDSGFYFIGPYACPCARITWYWLLLLCSKLEIGKCESSNLFSVFFSPRLFWLFRTLHFLAFSYEFTTVFNICQKKKKNPPGMLIGITLICKSFSGGRVILATFILATLLNSVTRANSFPVDALEFSMYKIVSAKRDRFSFSFPVRLPVISFSCLIAPG